MLYSHKEKNFKLYTCHPKQWVRVSLLKKPYPDYWYYHPYNCTFLTLQVYLFCEHWQISVRPLEVYTGSNKTKLNWQIIKTAHQNTAASINICCEMLLEIKVLHEDSILITVNTSRSRKTGSRANQESIWKEVPDLFYILLDIRYVEKCSSHFLLCCWATGKTSKSKQKMLSAFGTELCGEDCRDHPLHPLLRLDLPHAACPLHLSV